MESNHTSRVRRAHDAIVRNLPVSLLRQAPGAYPYFFTELVQHVMDELGITEAGAEITIPGAYADTMERRQVEERMTRALAYFIADKAPLSITYEDREDHILAGQRISATCLIITKEPAR